MDNRLRASNK